MLTGGLSAVVDVLYKASPALVYYCVGYLAPESGEQMMQPEIGFSASHDCTFA